VHPITAVQSEYSLWTRDPEDDILATLRELGIGFVAYSPLGRGFLTGQVTSAASLEEGDSRRNNPRFIGENFDHNLRVTAEVRGVADEVGATPAQVAIAWLLAKGDDIVPIPGTKRASRVEENAGADAVVLSTDQVARLTAITPAAGEHHNEAQMRMLDR
jgi:aryl-alcohol dehydrogenase-like predicted oxidoreductase